MPGHHRLSLLPQLRAALCGTSAGRHHYPRCASVWQTLWIYSLVTTHRENKQEFRHLRTKNDLGHVLFDLDASMYVIGLGIYAPDFSSLFNWNVKQLFVYVVAEYSTAKHVCLLALGPSALPSSFFFFAPPAFAIFLCPFHATSHFLLCSYSFCHLPALVHSVACLEVNTQFSFSLPRRLLQQPINQIVLWDKIILRGDQDAFKLENVRTKYPFFDSGDGLR